MTSLRCAYRFVFPIAIDASLHFKRSRRRSVGGMAASRLVTTACSVVDSVSIFFYA